MMKEEIIQLHLFLLQLKFLIEDFLDNQKPELYTKYDRLQIFPYSINRSKEKQTHALFELCKGMSDYMFDTSCLTFEKTSDNLEKICKRFRK